MLPTEIFDRETYIQIENDFFTDLRIEFKVEGNLRKGPNSATINIYGVSDAQLTAVLDRKNEAFIRLYAGYKGAASMLFTGSPEKNGVELDTQGGEKILRLKLRDSLRKYQRARLRLNVSSEMTYEEVLGKVIEAMQLPADLISLPDEIASYRFTRGAAFDDYTENILDELATMAGADWSVQNGRLLFLPKRQVRTASGPLFSDELNNILEAPVPTDKGVKITTLIYKPLKPGALFRVETKNGLFNGDYKVRAFSFQGDSGWAAPYYATYYGARYETTEAASRRVALETKAAAAAIIAASKFKGADADFN
jgi:hypothetical protein